MPGVSLLPTSPGLGSFASSQFPVTNGVAQYHPDMTVAEIKERAKQTVESVRKASPLSLINAARDQAIVAHAKEAEGDLKGALSALMKAANLSSVIWDTAEFKQEQQSGKKGVLWKEFVGFQKDYGSDLISRVTKLETKLTELELVNGMNGLQASDDGPVRKSGGSIADRMRSLQDAGMSVSTTKRFSRELTTASPTSPDAPRSSSRPPSLFPSPPPTQTTFNNPSPPSPSQHAFVAPSSLGPPSPTSSASSSPLLTHFSLSEFTHNFPSIDELDELDSGSTLAALPSVPAAEPFSLPSAPSGKVGSITSLPPPPSMPHELRRDDLPPPLIPRSPALPILLRTPAIPIPRSPALPIMPVDPGPRPASTPITPSSNALVSRPGSPALHAPSSPTIPRKPSGLGLGLGLSIPSTSTSTSTSPSPKAPSPLHVPSSSPPPELPVSNVTYPKLLHEYLRSPGIKILLLDVRTRDEFSKEHIKADTVVCLEPSVLSRDKVSGETIEDSMVVAPSKEHLLFKNRDKFDLVVVYDDASETFARPTSPLSALVRAIYETEFRKMLKKPPVLLVGGLQAWKRDVGADEVVGVADTSKFVGPAPSLINGMRNGKALHEPMSMPLSFGGRPRSGTESGATANGKLYGEERVRGSADSMAMMESSRSPISDPDDSPIVPVEPARRLVRKPAIRQQSVGAIAPPYVRTLSENITGQHMPQSMSSRSSAIQYPQFSQQPTPSLTGSSFSSSPSTYGLVSPPPQASINPSPLSRRRSDYVDQSQQAISTFASRPGIDYPDLSAQNILRPPPMAASSALERQDNRPRLAQHASSFSTSVIHGPKPPTIQSDYPVTYWGDMQIGISGLKNLGNTCYMNSIIQCLSATVPFARFFTDGRWKSAVNMMNPLGSKGDVAHAFAKLLHEMWQGELPYTSPFHFRRAICMYASQFGGSNQHDSQEFLSFLLDGLHEDLNRVLQKPAIEVSPEREAELEHLPQQIASEQEWKIYRMRNDSLIVDFFQGQFRNRMQCMTCNKTSTTYNAFMYLTLPIPTGRGISRVSIQQCLDSFVKEEIMEKSDAWNCPNCKTLRRATKRLSLSRLPPVLLIHLKRFSFKGPFTDKLETFVDFPLKNFDLTNYMPPPLPPGIDKRSREPISLDDPRSQIPPYKYDLYGVTNHFGSLSSGHYTAFISSRGGWLYCDDSRVTPTDSKEVVGRPAYILFYKRTQS